MTQRFVTRCISLVIEGFRVRSHRDGDEVLNDRDLRHGNCLVVDQDMPALSGLDLLSLLRPQVQTPAILITSHRRLALSELPRPASPLSKSGCWKPQWWRAFENWPRKITYLRPGRLIQRLEF